jgi:hypothetical protein
MISQSIFFSVLITLLNILEILFSLLDILIVIPITPVENSSIFFTSFLKSTGFSILSFITGVTRYPYIFILILYYFFYIVYWIIKNIIPDTGIATLFIPIKELLLKIPPLPQLEEYGVFRLIENINNAFGLSSFLQTIKKILIALGIFSHEHIKRIIKTFLPNLDEQFIDKSIENSDNSTNNSNNIKTEEPKSKNKLQIEKETQLCVETNSLLTPYKASESDKAKVIANNMKNKIKCEISAISKYINKP